MSILVYIGAQELPEEILKLPIFHSRPLLPAASLEGAARQLLAQHVSDEDLVIALLDTRGEKDIDICCEKALRANLPGHPTFIAIIDSEAWRAVVLENGADDYLLLPLIPSEVQTRISHHLRRRELARQQEETELYAAQTAFLALISRLIGEKLELNTILAQTLEQTTSLLNAWAGELWLYSSDQKWLELVSSLTPPGSPPRQGRRPPEQGIIGWVARQKNAMLLEVSPGQEFFDPRLDRLAGQEHYTLLATPLKHQQKTTGVLALYSHSPDAFARHDIELLEGIASLVASAIANVQSLQELRSYADQQQILFEMSQKISAGLDLQATANQAVVWINRLCNIEASVLWLSKKKDEAPGPIAATGIQRPDVEAVPGALQSYLAPWQERPQQPIIVNELHDSALEEALQTRLHNMLILPMIYRGETIGMVTLFNHIGGEFLLAEVTWLCTAMEMISIAIRNALLHEKTLKLIDERERLHQIALQSERLATIGRLTASLAHEINNPMQAIQGALSLALEEIADPQQVSEYLVISLAEAGRVARLVQRMRQIYRPPLESPRIIELAPLIEDVLEAAKEEMIRQDVKVKADLSPDHILITGVSDQLHLAFLSIMLRMAEILGEAGGGELHVQSTNKVDSASLEFTSEIIKGEIVSSHTGEEPSGVGMQLERLLNLSLAHDLVAAHNGTLAVDRCYDQACVCITLPKYSLNQRLERLR